MPLATEPMPVVELGFMFIGLGFFTFIMFAMHKLLFNENDRDYTRMINEVREFGIDGRSLIHGRRPKKTKRTEPKNE